jgi:hypothetical protein
MNRNQVKGAARESKHSGERPSRLLHGVEAQDALVALFDDFDYFDRAKNRRPSGLGRRVAQPSPRAPTVPICAGAPHLELSDSG